MQRHGRVLRALLAGAPGGRRRRAPADRGQTARGPTRRAGSAAGTASRVACLTAGLLLCVPPAVPVRAQEAGEEAPVIYKWVDEEGIAHFTADPERVPENVRSLIRKRAERDRPEPERARSQAGAAPERAERWAEMDAPAPDEESASQAQRPGAGGFSQGAAPGSRGPATVAPAAVRAQRAELEAQIAELEAQIARDEERIKDLLSRPREEPRPAGDGEEAAPVASPELREVAMRLPRLQAELRELRERRAQLEAR